MVSSGLQSAIDAAWPALTDAITRAKELEQAKAKAKALDELKKVVVRQTLDPTATQIPPRGAWGNADPDAIPGDHEKITGTKRLYRPDSAGLVELASRRELDVDELKELAPPKLASTPEKASSEGRPPNPFTKLVNAAVAQEFSYVMTALLDKTKVESEEIALDGLVDKARATFRKGPLVALVHRDVLDNSGEQVKKTVKAKLQGELLASPDDALEGQALVFRLSPDDVTWYTAREREPSWEHASGDKASIRVLSRLLLRVPEDSNGFQRQRYKVTPTEDPKKASTQDGAPDATGEASPEPVPEGDTRSD
jgi:hypothetical protein